jgi:hypothetical protein
MALSFPWVHCPQHWPTCEFRKVEPGVREGPPPSKTTPLAPAACLLLALLLVILLAIAAVVGVVGPFEHGPKIADAMPS